MAMVVKNNMSAITTLNTLNKNSGALSKSLGKVSTGIRINSAADDSSGYAISERMRVQIRSLDQDNRNAQNGSSMMKVAEGAVNSTIEILKTLKEKVINAANDTNTDSDRATIQKELDQSIDQIDDNANVTYNGKYLLDGSKNNKGVATHTTLTNQNLHTDTQATTKLTDLKSRAGDDLQIQKTDQITVSYVQSGKTYSTTFQAGDNDLQSIFNNAENIDTSTKTFASTDVESVATAMDVSKANSGDAAAVKKAVAALRATLGHADGDSTKGVQFKSGDKTTTDAAISAGTADFTVTHAGKGLRGEAITITNTNTATINGDLWKEVKAAGNDAQNAYKAMMAAGKALASAFKSESTTLTWDHQNGTNVAALRDESARNLISKMSSTTQAMYEDYLKKADTFYENKANAENLVNKYNDTMKELDALKVEDKFYDARKDYDRAVETFLSNLEETAANTEAEEFSYKDSNGNIQTSAKLDSNRGKFVKEMIADLRKQFMEVDPGNTSAKATDAADIMKTIKVGTNTVNGDSGDMVKGKTYGTLGSSATDIVNLAGTTGKALALNKAYGALSNVSTELEKAHNDAFQKYSGPQLITNNNIGTDGAGKLISTASGQNAVSITAANAGVDGQIAGFTIAVRDAQGNTKKSVEASLDAFDESIRGQNASGDNSINLQIGTKANMTINVGLTDMRSQALGLKGSDGSTLNIGNRENANAAINVLDNALAKVLDQATTIGAVQSRLEYTSSNLTTSSENVTASESTIRDADMAKEMTEYTKNNVLLQAAQSMLSQANQNSSAVLSLLQ